MTIQLNQDTVLFIWISILTVWLIKHDLGFIMIAKAFKNLAEELEKKGY